MVSSRTLNGLPNSCSSVLSVVAENFHVVYLTAVKAFSDEKKQKFEVEVNAIWKEVKVLQELR